MVFSLPKYASASNTMSMYLAFGDSGRFKISGDNSSFRCVIGHYSHASMVQLHVWEILKAGRVAREQTYNE